MSNKLTKSRILRTEGLKFRGAALARLGQSEESLTTLELAKSELISNSIDSLTPPEQKLLALITNAIGLLLDNMGELEASL